MDQQVKFPVFREPEDYMKMREKQNISGRIKRAFERRAIDRCLDDLAEIKSVCDVPSGPGRLFPHWKERGFTVYGVDYSDEMASASSDTHRKLGLDGSVAQGNAFELSGVLPEKPDLVASVRFVYYFDREKRIELLRSLAEASKRYVLVQYKTTQTMKGYINQSRNSEARRKGRERHMAKIGCSHYEIIHEIYQAGLVPLRIEAIGEFSDRVFVLAEKPQTDSNELQVPRLTNIRPPLRLHIAAMLLALFAVIFCMNIGDQSFWTKEEALYSLAARSVTEGNVLLPMLDVNDPATVPPLAPWWIATVSAVFGKVTEITARLANVIAAIAVLAILYFNTRRILNPWAALLGIAILGTSYEFWSNAGEAGVEIPFTVLTTLSWFSAYRVLERERARGSVFMTWAALGLAILTDGLYALPLTLIVLLLYCGVRFGRKQMLREFLTLKPISGICISLVPFAAWLAAILARENGPAYVGKILASSVIGRLLLDIDDYRIEFDSLTDLLMNMMPWALLLPFIVWELVVGYRRRAEAIHPLVLFSLCVLLGGFAYLALLLNSDDSQLMPMMPWAAIIVANFIWRRLVVARTAEPAAFSGREFGGRLLGLRFGRLTVAVFAMLMLAIGLYRGVALPFMDRDRSIKPFAEAVEKAVDSNDQLILFDDQDPRLMYYLRKKYTLIADEGPDLHELRELLTSGREYDIVVRRSEARHLANIPGVNLYFEATPIYRGVRYYILTTEQLPGSLPFNATSGQHHVKPRSDLTRTASIALDARQAA